jgi:hypothetical protein
MRSLVARKLVAQALDATLGHRHYSDRELLLTPSSGLRAQVNRYFISINVPNVDAVWFEIQKNGK